MTAALPGYVLGATLGQGSMGTVHLARRADWAGRLVAVKRVPAATPALARTLRHEAEVLAALDHPHIVRVLDLVPDGDGVAIAMQYAAGGSLPDLLARQGRLSPGEVVAVAAPLAAALASAHRRGLLHCDVKPANVLLTSDGEPLLSDFGLARRIAAPGPASGAGTGLITGTAEYLDPVVAAGGRADQRSDVYALGAVCYELISGHPPYSAATPEAVRAAALAGPPPALGSVSHGVPLALVQAVERAMARNPGDRFADAAAFAAALRAAAPPTPIVPAALPSLRDAGGGPVPSPERLCTSRFPHPAFWPGDGAPVALSGGPHDGHEPVEPAGVSGASPYGPRPDDAACPGEVGHRGSPPTRTFGLRPPRPAAEPVSARRSRRRSCRGRLLAAAAGLAAALGVAAVLGVAAALTPAGTGHSRPAAAAAPAASVHAGRRPCAAVAGPLRADDDGDGCPSAVSWEGNVADVGGRRYQLGRPGDALVVGDWDCDARATPELYRPSTGEVFLFDAWPGAGPEVAARAGTRMAPHGVASVERQAGGCDRIVVRPAVSAPAP